MDDMTRFEARFEERLRAFASTGVQSVDSAEVARAVAVSHPRSAATPPTARQLGGEVHRTRQRAVFGPRRTRSMFRSAFAAAAVVAVLVAGGSFFVMSRVGLPSPTPSSHPSASLPGVVAPSSTPSATAPNASAFPRTTGVWIATGSMGTPRSGHKAVRLLDGRVLVVGGADGDENDTSAELYDPVSGTWSATGNMLKRLGGFPATLLRDGRVLVGDGDDPNADDRARWNLGAEVYDPASGTWTVTGKMITPTKGAAATLLRDDTVLVTGADGAEVYDPGSGTWTATGKMTGTHQNHTAVLLSDGKVLVAGGYVSDGSGIIAPGIQESVELYDPATGTWTTTAPMSDPRNPISLTLLPDGKVLVTGGWLSDHPLPELYDPVTGTWTATANMVRPGALYGSAALLPDAKVLVMGGSDAELYDPGTGSWSTTGSMLRDHQSSPYTLLLDGTVLVAGGQDCSGAACDTTGSAELYVPAGVTPPSGLPTNAPPTPTPIPTPTPVPTAVPTPFPPEAGPVPPGARSWNVRVVNGSSQPVTLFVAEEPEVGVMGRLVGSVTPHVVPAGTTVEVTFLLPAKEVEGWGIFVNPIPGISAWLWGTQVPLAGEIQIGPDGGGSWIGPP